jgi:HEAT repeat protein
MLTDPSAEVREATAKSLRRLGWKPSTNQELAGFESALGKTRVAAGSRASALDDVLDELKDDTSFRRAAMEAKEANDPSKIAPLLQSLNDPDPSVRVSAITSLETELDETVTMELLKKFRDHDKNVRLVAAQVLARRPQPPAAHFLPLLKDENFEIRAAAVHFLGRLVHPALADRLIPLLTDKDNDVRHATAKVLGEMGAPEAIESLVIALADEDKLVRAAAEYSLQQIDPDWAQTTSALRAANELETFLDLRPAWVRSAIIHMLEKIRGVSPLRLVGDETEE